MLKAKIVYTFWRALNTHLSNSEVALKIYIFFLRKHWSYLKEINHEQLLTPPRTYSHKLTFKNSLCLPFVKENVHSLRLSESITSSSLSSCSYIFLWSSSSTGLPPCILQTWCSHSQLLHSPTYKYSLISTLICHLNPKSLKTEALLLASLLVIYPGSCIPLSQSHWNCSWKQPLNFFFF